MFIEFLEGGAGAKSALEEMLAAQLSTAERKIERLGAYVKTKHCRHRFISKHFGESLDEDCRTCDNCAASAAPSKLGEEHVLILKGVDCLPVRMASPGLVRALVGAPKCPIQAHEWPHLGALAHRAMEQVERMVGDLIDWGYLVRDGSIIRPVLELSMAGRRLLHGEMQNEKCKSQNDRSGRL
jgi:superfamily II DNA helicase RecQ